MRLLLDSHAFLWFLQGDPLLSDRAREAIEAGNNEVWLAADPEHCDLLATLPALHGDPFDRMLVAQAGREGLTLITNDSVIRNYGVPVLW